MSLILAALVSIVGYANMPSMPDLHVQVFKDCPVSWYRHGSLRADGGKFNPRSLSTIAHKTLPFGTKVLAVNEQTGKYLVLEVQDRGPFIKGREFDLAEGAAQYLGIIDSPDSQPKLNIYILPQKV